MKCPKCEKDLKSKTRICKFCGYDFVGEVFWQPTKWWHLRALGIIFFSLIIVYFLLNLFLGKYIRDIPNPW